MPYELLWEDRILVRRYYGHVTGQNWIASMREISADPRFDRIRAYIGDYSDAESLTVSDADAALYAALQIGAASSNPHIVTARVATEPAVVAELMGLAALYRPDIHAFIHPTMDAARRWIRDHWCLG